MRTRRHSAWIIVLRGVWLGTTSLACGFSEAIGQVAEAERAASEIETGSPGGHIAAQSNTPECREELRAALERFKTEQGFAYTVDDAQVESLLTTGAVAPSYVRDSVTTTTHFAVDGREGGCQVVYHERETREPGHYQQFFPRFSVPLAVCRCDPQ